MLPCFLQILEYIIGSAACACALSALVDILTDGAFSNITAAWAGPAPPDDSILREYIVGQCATLSLQAFLYVLMISARNGCRK